MSIQIINDQAVAVAAIIQHILRICILLIKRMLCRRGKLMQNRQYSYPSFLHAVNKGSALRRHLHVRRFWKSVPKEVTFSSADRRHLNCLAGRRPISPQAGELIGNEQKLLKFL